MRNRSAIRRLRQAINRTNQAIGGVDRGYRTRGAQSDCRDHEPRILNSIDEPKDGAPQTGRSAQPPQSQDPGHFDRRIANATVAMAIFTFLLFLLGIASAVIANRTLSAINGQLNEMRTASEQTSKLIASNADLAAAAKAQSLAEQQSAEAAHASLIMNQRARIRSVTAKLRPLQVGQGARATIAYSNIGTRSAPMDPDMYITRWSKDDLYNGAVKGFLVKKVESCLAVSSGRSYGCFRTVCCIHYQC